MGNLIVSAFTSFIVCTVYYTLFKLEMNKWLIKFFEEETKTIKDYLIKDKQRKS